MGTHPIFESDFDCLTEKMNLWSFLFLTAVSASSSSSTQENKLIRVVVNNTESEPSPCLRAEFTAEFEIGEQKIKLSDNVADIGSNCGLLNIKDNTTNIELTIGRIQLQPFKVPEDTFANPVICPQDISVVIPAIVGTILALLVILVLITYVIGRRRTGIAYQEI